MIFIHLIHIYFHTSFTLVFNNVWENNQYIEHKKTGIFRLKELAGISP